MAPKKEKADGSKQKKKQWGKGIYTNKTPSLMGLLMLVNRSTPLGYHASWQDILEHAYF